MRKPLFYNSRPSILESEIDQKLIFVQTPFLDLIFLILCYLFQRGPLENPVGAKMGSKIDQAAPKWHTNLKEALVSFRS